MAWHVRGRGCDGVLTLAGRQHHLWGPCPLVTAEWTVLCAFSPSLWLSFYLTLSFEEHTFNILTKSSL